MQFQTALDAVSAEVAFRVVRSSLTETLTATDRFVTGDPVILATATASADGNYIARPGNLNALVNNLFVGMVHSPTIEHGKLGLVQCYGFDTDANVGAATDTAIIPGSLLVPGTNRSLEIVAFVNPTGTATGDTGVVSAGLVGFAVVFKAPTATIATVTTLGGVDTGVFLRCL
jgi:hypothetical protein